MDLRFDNHVVIVTGAGQGLGRSYAREFARRGARVVVNDLGGGASGGGGDRSVAQMIVDEIVADGGQAVANGDSVEEGDKIVQCAMDSFGAIDILVNNAGILRDVSFAKMTHDDWDAIYRVHLLGSMRVTSAAWSYMRERSFGRILFTSSIAGIYGNFGQANYAAAKLGLVGLSNSLAIEGKSRNILVNAIAPTAGSRLTATVLPENVLAALKPELVTPIVIVLSHEASDVTGRLFEVGGGWVSETRWQQTEGIFFDHEFEAEDLLARWDDVTSFAMARNARSIGETRPNMEELLSLHNLTVN